MTDSPSSPDGADRACGEGELELLHALNAPEMTQHLASPEIEKKVLAWHYRYVALNDGDKGQVFRIVASGNGASLGSAPRGDSSGQRCTLSASCG